MIRKTDKLLIKNNDKLTNWHTIQMLKSMSGLCLWVLPWPQPEYDPWWALCSARGQWTGGHPDGTSQREWDMSWRARGGVCSVFPRSNTETQSLTRWFCALGKGKLQITQGCYSSRHDILCPAATSYYLKLFTDHLFGRTSEFVSFFS